MPSKETPSGSCEKTGGGEWTALRERVIGAFRKEICKHCKGGVPFSDERELAHTKTGRAERPNTPCNAWYEVSVLNRVLAEALAAAAPARQCTCPVDRPIKESHARVCPMAPPPQDGQGAELLGPPRGGSSSDLADSDSPSVGCYVASRASIPARSEMWRSLRSQGFAITSTWIDEAGEGETGDFRELWERIWREIHRSSHLVLYAEPQDFPLKGALVEVGIALGMGKRVVVVAPTVKLEGRTCRPLGSWIKHPNVSFQETLEAALTTPSLPEAVAGNASAPVGEKTISIVRRAHEIQEQHQALGPEPTTYPCKVKCKCGAEIEAANRDALTIVFVNHVVMEALAGQPSGVGEPHGYDSPKRRAQRDLVTCVMAVISGAPADNLPEDCAAIVKHWKGLNVNDEKHSNVARLEFWKGRLAEFVVMKSERPIDPCYWDMHHEREIREQIAALSTPSPTEGNSSPADARTELVQKEVGEGLREAADEINQCLQIIVTNAGNWPIMSDKLKGSHSFRRERKEAIECLKNIEAAVERAKKVTWAALAAPAPKPAPPAACICGLFLPEECPVHPGRTL